MSFATGWETLWYWIITAVNAIRKLFGKPKLGERRE